MPAEFREEKTLTAIKTTESILLFTQEVGIQQDNNKRERERNVERRDKDRLREKERTRRQLHWFCQTMVKYYKIFY